MLPIVPVIFDNFPAVSVLTDANPFALEFSEGEMQKRKRALNPM